MSEIIISIIIPTYNRSYSIVSCLESFVMQDYSSNMFEVIVVDNNSIDETESVIKGFIQDKANFSYIKELQKGSTNARHTGVRAARGKILIFADDDGVYSSNCINEIVKLFDEHPEVSAVTGKVIINWDQTPPNWITPYLFMLAQLDYGDTTRIERGLYLNGCLLAITKELFVSIGGFNPDLMGDFLIGDGDTGLVIKLHDEGRLIGYTPHVIMKHMLKINNHATRKDVGRRFYNTGISNTYGFYRKQGFLLTNKVLIYILRSLLFYLKKQVEYRLSGSYKNYFSLMQKKGELAFWLNLRHKAIRTEVKKVDCYHA